MCILFIIPIVYRMCAIYCHRYNWCSTVYVKFQTCDISFCYFIFSKSYFIIFQVEIDTDNTLKAMREGLVMLTCEKINPKKDNYVAEKYYANLSSPVVHKRYFNVVPFKQGQKFKLVDLV